MTMASSTSSRTGASPTDVRAAAWAQELSVDAELPLMLHASAMSANPNDIADMGPMSAGPLLDMGIHTVLNFSTSGDGHSQAKWNNAVQAYSESLPNRLPFNLSTNPRDFGGFPGNLALAASFDPELAKSVAKDLSKCYRAVGVTCLLGPQIDMCGEPRWSRITGAFGEDPALSRDMTRASVDGYQSTYDADGKDQGWGADSLGTQIKHFPGDGAGESGREAHSATGKYNVYPGDNLDASLVNFIDGGLNLDDSTKQASGVMTSYSIAYSDDGEYGEPVGSAYSKYKVDILREKCGYDGLICSDWAVTSDPEDYMHTNWGVENLTKAERYEKIIETGLDQVGGGSELDALLEGYSQYAEKVGKEAAEERVRESARRILLTYLLPGLVENPYTDPDEAEEFVARTHCTSLAVGVGTAHGVYKGTPHIEQGVLKEIRSRLEIPLVLHGTSGVPDDQVAEAIANGICKVNYATELRQAFTRGLWATWPRTPSALTQRSPTAPAWTRFTPSWPPTWTTWAPATRRSGPALNSGNQAGGLVSCEAARPLKEQR